MPCLLSDLLGGGAWGVGGTVVFCSRVSGHEAMQSPSKKVIEHLKFIAVKSPGGGGLPPVLMRHPPSYLQNFAGGGGRGSVIAAPALPSTVRIATELNPYIMRMGFADDVKIFLLEKLSDVEYHLAFSTSEKLQVSAMVGIFQVAKKATADSIPVQEIYAA